LFNDPEPGEADDVATHFNSGSLEVVRAKIEPSLDQAGGHWTGQFERLGYFCTDCVDHTADHRVFNRIVTLRDSWAKIERRG
jgi:glutaminyl-tRNA synthetase